MGNPDQDTTYVGANNMFTSVCPRLNAPQRDNDRDETPVNRVIPICSACQLSRLSTRDSRCLPCASRRVSQTKWGVSSTDRRCFGLFTEEMEVRSFFGFGFFFACIVGRILFFLFFVHCGSDDAIVRNGI